MITDNVTSVAALIASLHARLELAERTRDAAQAEANRQLELRRALEAEVERLRAFTYGIRAEIGVLRERMEDIP